jgi:hypothetical protein
MCDCECTGVVEFVGWSAKKKSYVDGFSNHWAILSGNLGAPMT